MTENGLLAGDLSFHHKEHCFRSNASDLVVISPYWSVLYAETIAHMRVELCNGYFNIKSFELPAPHCFRPNSSTFLILDPIWIVIFDKTIIHMRFELVLDTSIKRVLNHQ